MDEHRTIIGLQRASGGLGSSTLAGAVAACAAEAGRATLLVDLAPHGGGLDQLMGCGHEPGARWHTVHHLRLEDLGADEPSTEAVGAGGSSKVPAGRWTNAALPCAADARVLSHGMVVPASATLDARALQCVAALAAAHEVTVLDLPTPDHPRAVAWWHLCDTVVLLTGSSLTHVSSALVVRSLLPRVLGVVARPCRGGGVHAQDVADLLGPPLLGELEHDPDAVAAQHEQRAPGTRPGPLRDMATRILAEVEERRHRGSAA